MAEIQKMTGFQSACAEFGEDRISLDKKYITNQAAMFPVALEADHKGFELRKGDNLIIDRSLDPRAGDLVIAVISNEFHVARYVIGPAGGMLMPFNKKVGDVELEEDFIWGVVASVHRKYR